MLNPSLRHFCNRKLFSSKLVRQRSIWRQREYKCFLDYKIILLTTAFILIVACSIIIYIDLKCICCFCVCKFCCPRPSCQALLKSGDSIFFHDNADLFQNVSENERLKTDFLKEMNTHEKYIQRLKWKKKNGHLKFKSLRSLMSTPILRLLTFCYIRVNLPY